MSVTGQSRPERANAAEASLEGLRASVEVVERVAIDPNVGPELRKRVNTCMREFLTLPLPQQPSFDDAILSLERSLTEVDDAVFDADLEVPIGTFRRKLNPGTLKPTQLATYARRLATRPFKGGPHQARFIIAVTHALCEVTAGHGLALRPDGDVEATLDLLLEGRSRDEDTPARVVAKLDEAREALTRFASAEQMFEANFDHQIKRIKEKLGDALLNRAVLRALVRFEVAFLSRQLAIPASPHPMSIPPGPRVPSKNPPRRPSLRAAVAASLRPPPPPPPPPTPTKRQDGPALDELLSEVIADAGPLEGAAPLDAIEILPAGEPEASAADSGLAGQLEPDSERVEHAAISDEAGDRVAAIGDALAIMKELGVERSHVELVERTFAMCADSLERLGDPESRGYTERLVTFEESLAVGESTTQDADAAVSMESFRSWYERTPRPREQLLRYASLLGAARRLRDVQRDRLEFLATRLLSHELERSRLALSPRSEAAPVLDYIIRTRPFIQDHERSSTVMFFRDATLQLATLQNLDDVFSGGFYLDVRGYKVALREQLMDPDVLYAAVSLNVAIHNRIEEMRELEARSRASLHDMLGSEEEEVQKAFQKRASMGAEGRFEETRRYLEKYRDNVEKGALRATVDRRTVMRILMGAAIVGAGLFAFKLIDRDVNSLDEMSAADLQSLSPVLESGAISRGQSQPAFIGRVASGRWMLLTPEERRAAAEELAAQLLRRQVRAAWVTRDGHQAIQIEDGEVVSVE